MKDQIGVLISSLFKLVMLELEKRKLHEIELYFFNWEYKIKLIYHLGTLQDITLSPSESIR